MFKRFILNLEEAIANREELLGVKLSNDEIGSAIGTVGQNVWRWRTDKAKKVPENYIDGLAKYLGVSADWLLNNDSSDPTTPIAAAIKNKRSIVDLSALYTAYRNFDRIDRAIQKSQYRFFDILPHLNNYLDIFAAFVVTDSLAPKYDIGDVIVVAPKEEATKNDYIIIVGAAESHMFNGVGYHLAKLIKRTKNQIEISYFEAGESKLAVLKTDEFIELHKILSLNAILNIETL